MWTDILKVKQITTPVTDINIKKVPKKKKKEKNCKERWMAFVKDWEREIKHELMRAEFKGDFKEHKKSTLGLKSHHWSNLGVYNMSLKIRYPDEKDDEFYCDLLEYGFTDWFSRAASAPHDRRVFKTISFTPNSVLNKRGTAIHYGNHVVITMVWNSNMPEEKADTFKYQFQEATSRACETHSIPHR